MAGGVGASAGNGARGYGALCHALLTSLCALPGSLLAGGSGYIIKHTSFETFFIGTSLMGIPVAILAWWVWREQERRGVDPLVETSPERAAETD